MNLEKEIEIGPCDIEFNTQSMKKKNEYNPKHRFSKNTTYKFSNYIISFKNYEKIEEWIEVTIYNLTIEFPIAIQQCDFKNENMNKIIDDFDSTETSYMNAIP
ncbi:hypothetical protein RF11_14133 [Thelohanellus kitauei]|uniref:Uncharacterized protein n=1 Tax=Thelohanellus kitauei TaxID=669202 RepID=A0A0C2JSG4_THEKT|nr:hypothetical protein RF11_14133 [Thelohanellus kitauei]